MRKNNLYGYKIGYRENGSLLFNRLFITRSYNHAISMRNFYRRYIKRERDTNRPLINPFWEIVPITKKEILAGIWDEPPFQYIFYEYTPYKFPFRRGYRSIGKTRKSNPAEKIFNSFYIPYPSKNFFLVWFDFRAIFCFRLFHRFSLCTFAPAAYGKKKNIGSIAISG